MAAAEPELLAAAWVDVLQEAMPELLAAAEVGETLVALLRHLRHLAPLLGGSA